MVHVKNLRVQVVKAVGSEVEGLSCYIKGSNHLEIHETLSNKAWLNK